MEINENMREVLQVEAPAYSDTYLHWYGCSLHEIARQHGTPSHVGCSEAVKDSLDLFHSAFAAANLTMEVRYSVKTNPLPAFLKTLADFGAGFEVCSGYELALVKELGVEGKRIVATGLREGFPFAREACETGVDMLTVATAGQLKSIIADIKNLPGILRLGLTICPELLRGRWDLTLNTGAKGAAIGFRPGSPLLDEAIRTIASHRKLDLVGLHMHIGSGIRSAAPYLKAIKILEKVIMEAARLGKPVTRVDIGGGYGLRSAPVLGAWKIVSSILGPGGSNASHPQAGSILNDVANIVSRSFDRLQKEGIRPEKLIAEPGRIVSGPCQLLLLSVVDVIDRGHNERFLLCDGGSMAISPMLMAERHRLMSLVEPDGELLRYRVLGNLPTSLDRVSASALLPAMRAGDRIAVLDTGAYFVSMNNTFIGPRPPVIWIENKSSRIARRRETGAEVFSRDE